MKTLLIAAAAAFLLCIDSAESNRLPGRLRRTGATGATDAEKAAEECVKNKCLLPAWAHMTQLKTLFGGSNVELTEESMTALCNSQDSLDECLKQCTLPSSVQDLVDAFGIVGYICDNEREAFQLHASCVITALKTGVEELKQCVFSDFINYAMRHHELHKEQRRRRALEGEGGESPPLMGKIRESAATFPVLTCPQFKAGRDCAVKRVKEECDEDGTSTVSLTTERLIDEMMKRIFKMVKAVNPAYNAFKVDKCIESGAEEPLFFFW